MPATHVAHLERERFCDALELAGPVAPTLCEGWLTRDLAAHVVLRERRPDLAAGILVPSNRRHRAIALAETSDTDADGVPDAFDTAPQDPTRH